MGETNRLSDQTITMQTHLHRLSLEDNKVFCSHHQEAAEFVRQHHIHVIHLLNFDAEAQRVDARLNQASLTVITADLDRVQQ